MAIEDLEWWHRWRGGDLGLHGIRYDGAPSKGIAVDDIGYKEHHIASATRARRISDVLERLSHDQQRALRAFYTPLLPAIREELGDAYGAIAGIVLVMHPTEARPVARDRSAMRRQSELRVEAHLALVDAENAYLAACAHQSDDHHAARRRRVDELRARLRGAA